MNKIRKVKEQLCQFMKNRKGRTNERWNVFNDIYFRDDKGTEEKGEGK